MIILEYVQILLDMTGIFPLSAPIRMHNTQGI